MLSTISENAPSCCSKYSCQKKLTSDSWRLKHIKLHHPEQLQVARQKNRTSGSVPRCVEPTRRREFDAYKGSVEHLDAFPYLGQVENIADSESQPPPPLLLQTEIYPSASTLLINYIAEQWEPDALGCLETNLQNNSYHLFAMHDEYQYIQCGIKKKGMKMYYDNLMKEDDAALRFPSFKNGDCVQSFAASMADDRYL
jgi:hypothetical protein